MLRGIIDSEMGIFFPLVRESRGSPHFFLSATPGHNSVEYFAFQNVHGEESNTIVA